MTEAAQAIISFVDLKMTFKNRVLYEHLNLDIQKGDFFCLLGSNGTGKTTLIYLLLGLLTPSDGKIWLNPEMMTKNDIGYVPQFRNIEENYPLSIENFVALKLSHSLRPWLSRSERLQVRQALEKTNLWQKRKQIMGKASGGEKQRAYLAQAILNQPKLLILDESTASLDQQSKYDVLDLVAKLNRENQTTIIFISHDWPLVKKYGKHYLELFPGKFKYGKVADLAEN
ncbi:Zinc ABC transporterATP-binding protein [Oenococcus kitaharae DSM 17330]|uniref:Zinc ABC transporterATP-binding protein n=2 Tax=Oenococcus kitaharae TaxID=336988 RepID=G9WG89_9LACO|nr:Zinc ABC transporterATP-binding protein [Oenococcus kitaharae DSM 17330]OEY83530.1 ABC transporter ATP-binding protein [Oenococcus kitaharae]OEY85329.1 ABC transporter ATP-binding protein [Oenococcus kitaharae]OEY86183.1 ABC transporter ATP-binding protein [Oenococcus kitaharae]